MRRLDDKVDEVYLKACIYGPPGTGKTSFGTSAPKPLIALTELQGMTHVRQAAQRLGVPVPQSLFIEHANDLRNLVRALHGDRTKPFRVYEMHETQDGKKEKICVHEAEWPETLVLDSATDACRLLIEEIRAQSPMKAGSDGLPVDSQRFWGVLIQRATSMILSIRDLPMNVVFLALADDKEKGDDDNKVRSVTPRMATRDLSVTLAAAVNVVGYTYRRTFRAETKAGAKPEDQPQRAIQYSVMTTGPEYMTTKPYRPLRDNEVPDFTYWLNVVRGQLTEQRPAPLPSQEMGGGDVSAADKPLVAEPSDPVEPAAAAAGQADAADGGAPAAEPEAAPKASKKRRAG